jgi:hypothetical protein
VRRAPSGPFPGASPGFDATPPRGVVIGRYAECYLFGAVVANLFDWEVKPVFDYTNLTAHGDYWQINAFLDAGWTARARGYLSLLGATYIKSATSANIPAALSFVGYTTLAAASSPFIVWTGSCFIKEGGIFVPMALVEQEITVIGTGTPSAGLT